MHMDESTTRPSLPPIRFWRVVFWVTCAHLILMGLVTFVQLANNWGELGHVAIPWRSLGLVKAGALWLDLHTEWFWCGLVLADLAAMALTWKLAWRWWRPSFAAAYLLSIGGLVAGHMAATAYLTSLGVVRTPQMTYPFEHDVLIMFAWGDAVLSMPAWLVLAGCLFVGRPRRIPGFCSTCGYNLTGNLSGVCPECGTPIPADLVRRPLE